MLFSNRHFQFSALTLAGALLLTGCCGCDAGDDATKAVASADAATTTNTTNTDSSTNATDTGAAFDIHSVPLSALALGAFPYLQLPDGYQVDSHLGQRFGFWLGDRAELIDGKTQAMIITHSAGKYSRDDIAAQVDGALTKLGAVKVFDGMIAQEKQGEFTAALDNLQLQLGDISAHSVSTYVIRRDDGNVWAHLLQSSDTGNLVITHAGLSDTPASDSSAQSSEATVADSAAIEASVADTGKIALQVNFATGKTDILTESQAQIKAVAEFLNTNPDIKAAINGYTDNVGDPKRNQALSEARAKAVVAAIVAQGVDAARLSAHGYGDKDPIADNATADGRAQNRRVELVQVQ